MDNYKKDGYDIHSLKEFVSGTIIFDRYGVYHEIRDEYRNNKNLNATFFGRKRQKMY